MRLMLIECDTVAEVRTTKVLQVSLPAGHTTHAGGAIRPRAGRRRVKSRGEAARATRSDMQSST